MRNSDKGSLQFGLPVLIDTVHGATQLDAVPIAATKGVFNEAWLQNLIHDHPLCLPIGEIEPAFMEVASVCKELPTGDGFIDNFLMTPEGDLVLVEVKLWRNPEARRTVVAQALDYASSLFAMGYEQFETAVLKGNFGKHERPKRLYDLFARPDGMDQAAFIDAVSANLQKGRALVLVVGDGIRTETERLTRLVQSHAGRHFTFALVELKVFAIAASDQILVCPRTLARTEMLYRATVEIDDKRATVLPSANTNVSTTPVGSISAEQFYEAMDKIGPGITDGLRTFIAKIEPLGVYADFQRSLNFKWDPPKGAPINLGYIERGGHVWIMPSTPAAPDLGHLYVEELAAAFGMTVDRQAFGDSWSIRDHNNHAPRINEIKLDIWQQHIERFLDHARERLA